MVGSQLQVDGEYANEWSCQGSDRGPVQADRGGRDALGCRANGPGRVRRGRRSGESTTGCLPARAHRCRQLLEAVDRDRRCHGTHRQPPDPAGRDAWSGQRGEYQSPRQSGGEALVAAAATGARVGVGGASDPPVPEVEFLPLGALRQCRSLRLRRGGRGAGDRNRDRRAGRSRRFFPGVHRCALSRRCAGRIRSGCTDHRDRCEDRAAAGGAGHLRGRTTHRRRAGAP